MKNRNQYKQIICTALGWDELDYQLYQFETAFEYLEQKIAIRERIQQIAETKSWWMWWTNQWQIIDRHFVDSLSMDMDMAQKIDRSMRYDLEYIYRDEHNPSFMRVYPSRVVRQLIENENAGKLKINN